MSKPNSRSDINFELNPKRLMRIRFNNFSFKFGGAELEERTIAPLPRDLEEPQYQKMAGEVVGWVEQLANSPTFLQPPITGTLVK